MLLLLIKCLTDNSLAVGPIWQRTWCEYCLYLLIRRLLYLNMIGTVLRVLRQPFAQVKHQFMKITPAAQQRLLTLIEKSNDPQIIGVKISLTKKGCSGLSYTMTYVKDTNKFDQIIDGNGFKIIIDSKALMALVGTEMDYVKNDLGSQFVFKNPNEKGRCGCGESFHI